MTGHGRHCGRNFLMHQNLLGNLSSAGVPKAADDDAPVFLQSLNAPLCANAMEIAAHKVTTLQINVIDIVFCCWKLLFKLLLSQNDVIMTS